MAFKVGANHSAWMFQGSTEICGKRCRGDYCGQALTRGSTCGYPVKVIYVRKPKYTIKENDPNVEEYLHNYVSTTTMNLNDKVKGDKIMGGENVNDNQ
ncbi:hypothetical protein CHS0354_013249 [Potamilus streckersoni]|uniref:Uncharacterized protein n=1 Tax=Potamilus streckersoni TaxID=2493646 RepID=A0AAE0VPE0_9BIVA|nr:hypothetical protein CHS0354_013249 [Potamilus streckersoni]